MNHTQYEIIERFNLKSSGISSICNGDKLHYRGIIMSDNKDKYYEIVNMIYKPIKQST